MNGIIIYKQDNCYKNQYFVKHFEEVFLSFSKQNKISLIYYEKIKDMQNVNMLKAYLEKEKIIFAINRTMDYNLSESLESLKIKVFNNSRVSKICNHKGKLAILTQEKQIAIPSTIVFNNFNIYKEKLINFKFPFVLKVANGHGGNEVYLIKTQLQLHTVSEMINGKDIIIQKYLGENISDIRFYIIGDKIVTAVERLPKPGEFKSNFSLGGIVKEFIWDKQIENFIIMILKKLELKQDYIGIDIFKTEKNQIYLNEIEDNAGAKMAYKATTKDLIALFATNVYNQIKAQGELNEH